MKQLILLIVFILSNFSLVSQPTVNTLFSSPNKISFLKVLGNKIAWLEEFNGINRLIISDNGIMDTITPPAGITIWSYEMSETVIAWDARDIALNSYVYTVRYYNGASTIDNFSSPIPIVCTSNSDYIIRSLWASNIELDIIDTNNNIIFQMPDDYQGYNNLVATNIMDLKGSTLYFKAAYSDVFGNFVFGIFRLDLINFLLEEVYTAPLDYTIFFNENQCEDEAISFSLQLSNSSLNTQKDLYLLQNNNVDLIYSTNDFIVQETHTNYRNGLLYFDMEIDSLLYYHNGLVDTLNNCFPLNDRYPELNKSECYLGWKSTEGNPSRNTVYTIFNGFQTDCVVVPVDSYLSTREMNMNGDKMYDTIIDGGLYHIIEIDFDFECAYCTGQDIVTNTEENNFSDTYIESTTQFNINTDAYYQAANYILLDSGFEVPRTNFFSATIDPCN